MSRWQRVPRSVRTTALAVVVVLAYGTAVHVAQLVASSLDPQRSANAARYQSTVAASDSLSGVACTPNSAQNAVDTMF